MPAVPSIMVNYLKSIFSEIHDHPYAPTIHTHSISDITGLQDALDGKSDTGHTHTKSEITDFYHTHALASITDISDLTDAINALATELATHVSDEYGHQTVVGQTAVIKHTISVVYFSASVAHTSFTSTTNNGAAAATYKDSSGMTVSYGVSADYAGTAYTAYDGWGILLPAGATDIIVKGSYNVPTPPITKTTQEDGTILVRMSQKDVGYIGSGNYYWWVGTRVYTYTITYNTPKS